MDRGKVLGVDFGTKRVGIATGDLELSMAFARGVIENRSDDFVVAEMRNLCKELAVKKIVFGLPLNMEENQEENPLMDRQQQFIDLLSDTLLEVEIELFDERLSSYEADQLIAEIPDKNMTLGRDAYAAQVILQRYFDSV